MPPDSTVNYAVELYFDGTTEQTITNIRKVIADAGYAPRKSSYRYRPHVSLGIYEGIDLEEAEPVLQQFAESHPAFPVNFPNVGMFMAQNQVIFIGVTVTQHLLKLHKAFHDQFDVHTISVRDYYRPNRWTPHCTLVDQLPSEDIPQVLSLCQPVLSTILNQSGTITSIGTVELSTGREVFRFPLYPKANEGR